MFREVIPYLGAGTVIVVMLAFLFAVFKEKSTLYVNRIVALEDEITKLRKEISHKDRVIHECVLYECDIEERLEKLGIEAYDEYGHIGILNMLERLIEQRNHARMEVVRLVREQTVQHMKQHNERRTHGHY